MATVSMKVSDGEFECIVRASDSFDITSEQAPVPFHKGFLKGVSKRKYVKGVAVRVCGIPYRLSMKQKRGIMHNLYDGLGVKR